MMTSRFAVDSSMENSGRRYPFLAFEDLTLPEERTFGFYRIEVAEIGLNQVVRASHRTAGRIARSRTQYGQAELSFLDAIETPALD
jgi:hypothetical protein